MMAYAETRADRWTTEVIGCRGCASPVPTGSSAHLGCCGVVATYRVVRTEVFVMSLQRFGAEECVSWFCEQGHLLAQFLDGFPVTMVGDDRLALSHERLELMDRASAAA